MPPGCVLPPHLIYFPMNTECPPLPPPTLEPQLSTTFSSPPPPSVCNLSGLTTLPACAPLASQRIRAVYSLVVANRVYPE